jgi:hypothetical protein
MKQFAGFLLLIFLPLLFGLWVGWSADSARWSAMLLALEPVLDLGLVVIAYWFWSGGRRLWGSGLLTGMLLLFGAVRFPFPVLAQSQSELELPLWVDLVSSCTPAVEWPGDGVRVLQWALPLHFSQEEVVRVADSLRPDLLVLSRVHSPELADALLESLGGEYLLQEPTGAFNGRILLARGLFRLCGEQSSWSYDNLHMSFAGITNATTAPLLSVYQPGPFRGWEESQAGWEQTLALLQRIQSPAMLVVADAPVLPTWRYLEEFLRGVNLLSAPTPPSWPAHIGGLPMLPLHPHARLWVGPGWKVTASQRIGASGVNAPILTSLEPVRR